MRNCSSFNFFRPLNFNGLQVFSSYLTGCHHGGREREQAVGEESQVQARPVSGTQLLSLFFVPYYIHLLFQNVAFLYN